MKQTRKQQEKETGQGSTRRLCNFFNTAHGCQNGDNCSFLHIKSPNGGRAAAAANPAANGGRAAAPAASMAARLFKSPDLKSEEDGVKKIMQCIFSLYTNSIPFTMCVDSVLFEELLTNLKFNRSSEIDRFLEKAISTIESVFDNEEIISIIKKFQNDTIEEFEPQTLSNFIVHELKTTFFNLSIEEFSILYSKNRDHLDLSEEFDIDSLIASLEIFRDELNSIRLKNNFASKEFLESLKSKEPRLISCADFDKVVTEHNQIIDAGETSPYDVPFFMRYLDIFQKRMEAESIVKMLTERFENEKRLVEAQLILSDKLISSTEDSKSKLKCIFALMTTDCFKEFMSMLDLSELEILLSLFTPFILYLSSQAQSISNVREITSEYIFEKFKRYCKMRKCDEPAQNDKRKFIDFSTTEVFHRLCKIFETQTSSTHANGKSIYFRDMFKFIMKDILNMFLSQVKEIERNSFIIQVVKLVLRFILVLSLRPDRSDLLSGRWNKGTEDRDTKRLKNVYAYSEMKNPGARKSVHYYLLEYLNASSQNQRSSTKSKCDCFEKLPGEFRHHDGTFSRELLLHSIESIGNRLMNSRSLEIKFDELIQKFGCMIILRDSTFYITDEYDTGLLGIGIAFGIDETDHAAREWSLARSLMTVDRDQIIRAFNAYTIFLESQTPDARRRSTIQLLQNFEISDIRENHIRSLTELMNLIRENTSPDLLRNALCLITLSTKLFYITTNHRCYLKLTDAVVIILLSEKYPGMKLLDIMNLVYGNKHPGLRINVPAVKNHKDYQDDSRLVRLIGEGQPNSSEADTEAVGNHLKSLTLLLSKADESQDTLNDKLNTYLSVLLNSSLIQDLASSGTQFTVRKSDEVNSSFDFNLKIKEMFKDAIIELISPHFFRLLKQMKERMETLKSSLSLAHRFQEIYTIRNVMILINLLNLLFNSLGVTYTLEYDEVVSNFPKTFRVPNPVSIMSAHVRKVLKLQPDNPLIFAIDIVLSLIYREPIRPMRKAMVCETIDMASLQTVLLNCESLNDVVTSCRLYLSSFQIRDLIFGILNDYRTRNDVSRISEIMNSLPLDEFINRDTERQNLDMLRTFLEKHESTDSDAGADADAEKELLQRVKKYIKDDRYFDLSEVITFTIPSQQSIRQISITVEEVQVISDESCAHTDQDLLFDIGRLRVILTDTSKSEEMKREEASKYMNQYKFEVESTEEFFSDQLRNREISFEELIEVLEML